MNFVKLKNKFSVGEFNPISTKNQYGFDVPNIGFVGIKYSYIDMSNPNNLLNIIPENYRDQCTLSLMKLNYEIPPHTDSGIEAIINFYVKTDGCLTQFYKLKNNNFESIKIQNQTDGFILDPKDLELADSFVAEDGDAYLLDVSKPHSVIPNTKGKFVNRQAICMQFLYKTFDEAKEMLQQTGQI